MLTLPDAIQIGPLVLPTYPLALIAGFYAWYALAARSAQSWGLTRGQAEAFLTRVLVGALAGAKLMEVARSPVSFIESPRLLVAIPVGVLPLAGALAGAALWAGFGLRGRWHEIPRLLDNASAPLAVGLAIISLGSGESRALLLAAAHLGVAVALHLLRRQARFRGHLALAAVVFGSLVLVAADFARPAQALWGGVTLFQLLAATAGAAAYAAASLVQRRRN